MLRTLKFPKTNYNALKYRSNVFYSNKNLPTFNHQTAPKPPCLAYEAYLGVNNPEGSIIKKLKIQTQNNKNDTSCASNFHLSLPGTRKKDEFANNMSTVNNTLFKAHKVIIDSTTDSSSYIRECCVEIEKLVQGISSGDKQSLEGEVFPQPSAFEDPKLHSTESDRAGSFVDEYLVPIQRVLLALYDAKYYFTLDRELNIKAKAKHLGKKVTINRRVDVGLKFQGNDYIVPIEFKRKLPERKFIFQNINRFTEIDGVTQSLEQMMLLGVPVGVLSSFCTVIIIKVLSVNKVKGKAVVRLAIEVAEYNDSGKTARAILHALTHKCARLSPSDIKKSYSMMKKLRKLCTPSEYEITQSLNKAAIEYWTKTINENQTEKALELQDVHYKELVTGIYEDAQIIQLRAKDFIKETGLKIKSSKNQMVNLHIYDPIIGSTFSDDKTHRTEEIYEERTRNLYRAYEDLNVPVSKGLIMIKTKGNYSFCGKYHCFLVDEGLDMEKDVKLTLALDASDKLHQKGYSILVNQATAHDDEDQKVRLSLMTLNEDRTGVTFLEPAYCGAPITGPRKDDEVKRLKQTIMEQDSTTNKADQP